MLKKTFYFIIFTISSFIIYSNNSIDFVSIRNTDILNKKVFIITDSVIYKNLNSEEIIKKINNNEEVEIIDIIKPDNPNFGKIFQIKNNNVFFYKIKTKDMPSMV